MKSQNATHLTVRATYKDDKGDLKTFELPRISLKLAETMVGAMLGFAIKGKSAEQQKQIIAGAKQMLRGLQNVEPFVIVDLKDESSQTTAFAKTTGPKDASAAPSEGAPRWFKLTVENQKRGLDGELKLPLELAGLGLSLLPLFSAELGGVLGGIDLGAIGAAIEAKKAGTVLNEKTKTGETAVAVIE